MSAKRFLSLFAMLCMVLFLYHASVRADEVAGDKAITFGPVTSNSIFSPATNPGNSGVNAESVNLFTGQFQESFPLVAIAGRGGRGVTLTLDYNGNVTSKAKLENHQAQASPFGLGFSIGGQSIVCNHNGSATLADDDYQLIINGSSIGLKYVENDRFVPTNGEPWQIHRTTAVVAGTEVVIGWEVITDDGTVYSFGDYDTSLSEYNATRYVFRYGNYVGNGATNDEQPYPNTWDLSEISDPEGLNVTTFDYYQEKATFQVKDINNLNSLVTTTHLYTRASYIDSITTPEGSRIRMEYSDRTDYQPFYDYNMYEYFSTKKAERLEVVSPTDEVLSVTTFEYDYLLRYYSEDNWGPFKKLILKAINNLPGDESGSAPPLRFEYNLSKTNIAYGAISEVHYPSGSIKKIYYSKLDAAENMSELHADVANATTPYKQYVTRNMYVNMESSTADAKVAYWDGYWHVYNPNNYYQDGLNGYINYGLSKDDIPGVSPDGWLVLYSRTLESLLVWKWKGGYFDIDTIATPFTRGSNRIGVYPTKDAFVVTIGGYGNDGHGTPMRKISKAYYYKWEGDAWVPYLIDDAVGGRYLSGVKVNNNVFALSYYSGGGDHPYNYDSYMRFGAYDYDASPHALVCQPVVSLPYNLVGGKFAVGPNSVSYQSWATYPDNIYSFTSLNRFENSTWTETHLNYPTNAWRVGRAIESIPNGFVYAVDNDDRGHQSYLRGAFYSASGWTHTSLQLSADQYSRQVGELHAAGHFVVTQNICNSDDPNCGNTDANLWRWNGTNFEYRFQIEHNPPNSHYAEVFQNSYAWGSHMYFIGPITGRQFLGNNTWSGNILNTPTQQSNRYAASENFAVCNLTSTSNLFHYRPFYNGFASNYVQRTVRTNTGTTGRFYAAGDVFFINALYNYSETQDIYKLVDTSFTGPANIVYVDSIAIVNPGSETQFIDYAFYRGLVGQDGVTPKFAKAEVSLPYFASEGGPEGWNVSYFYNDLSHISIPDGHYMTTVNTPYLDSLPLPPFYGLHNGGYLLDGQRFLTYSYSTDSSTSENVDYTKYFYTLKPTVDTVDGVYKTFLVKTVSRNSGILDTTLYYYDEYNGQLTNKTTYFKQGVKRRWKIENTAYAYADQVDVATANAMKADNAISQVLSHTITMNDYWVHDTLVATGARYAKHGYWIPAEEFTWRDYGNRLDTLYTSRLSDVDEYGNVLSMTNVEGTASVMKYDTSGTKVIASATNCGPIQLIAQDFEQGTDWDGWTSWSLGGARTLDTDAYTGEYCLKMIDPNPNDTAHIWSPRKKIAGFEFNTRDYYFSAWVKSNHIIRVFCFTFDSNGDECNSKMLEFSGLDPNKWQKIEGVFSDVLQINCVDSVDFRWILVDEPAHPAPPGAFLKIDNIRMHPIDAHVTTKVYDKSSGLVTADLGLNNIPKKYEYDKFQRPAVTRNYQDEILSKSEYHSSMASHSTYVELGVTHSTSFIVPTDQRVTYSIRGYVATNPDDFAEYTIYVNDVVVDHYYYNPQSGIYRDSYVDVEAGDEVRAVIDGYSLNGVTEIRVNLQYNVFGDYNASDPHWTKTTDYSTGDHGYDSTVTISYYDALGRGIQTRTLHYNGTSQAALVNGVQEYDGRGRVVKTYNPYYDVVSPSGVTSFTSLSQVPSEANAYYNGSNDYDCEGYPYSEMEYNHDFRGRVRESSQPGNDWRMGSGHTTQMDYDQSVTDTSHLYTVITTDPDGIVAKNVTDTWNLTTIDSSLYLDDLGNPAVGIKYTYSNFKDHVDSAGAGDGTNRYILNRIWYNDMGFQDSAWIMDYGTIRKLYDKAGNLRFIQDDKHRSDSVFVYNKYDCYGRKIEEGTLPQYIFLQAAADLGDFPPPGYALSNVKYRWEYDHSGDRHNYGKLMFTTEGDSSYYQEFHYYPFANKDSVVTKLKVANGDLKSVVHHYDGKNGQLEKKVIYPYESSVGVRSLDYQYDMSGRIEKVQESNPDDSPLGYVRNYAEYDYFLGGRLKSKLMGVYNGTARYDTVQVLDFHYNALGMLTGINNPDSIVYGAGIGEDYPHYGLTLDYTNGGSGYYNGRIAYAKTTNSTTTSFKSYAYNYTYNQLGWLVDADNTLGTAYDRHYWYNPLGYRDSVNFGGTVKRYDYRSVPGSSQLYAFNGTAQKRFYDEAGNLYQDDVNDIYQLDYDYRNQITYANVREFHMNDIPQELWFDYNSDGMRIFKKFSYAYKAPCGGPDIEDPYVEMALPGGKSGGLTSDESKKSFSELVNDGTGADKGGIHIQYCAFRDTVETHYLYDGNSLVMTFNEDDEVKQFYVEGKGTNVAVYPENDDSKLLYQISDQVGSTRLLLTEAGIVKQYIFYHPFGEIMDQFVSYDEPMKFTGKELDDHSSFTYYYFGSRYYDARIGQFTSVDPKAQFTSGYIYGNNPVLGVDPDGNFFVALMVYALKAYAIHSTMQTAMNVTQAAIEGQWGSVIQQVGMYGVGMGTGMMANGIAGSVVGKGTGVLASTARGALGGVISNGLTNTVSGQKFFKGIGKAAGMGAARGYVAGKQYQKKMQNVQKRYKAYFRTMQIARAQFASFSGSAGAGVYAGFGGEGSFTLNSDGSATIRLAGGVGFKWSPAKIKELNLDAFSAAVGTDGCPVPTNVEIGISVDAGAGLLAGGDMPIWNSELGAFPDENAKAFVQANLEAGFSGKVYVDLTFSHDDISAAGDWIKNTFGPPHITRQEVETIINSPGLQIGTFRQLIDHLKSAINGLTD